MKKIKKIKKPKEIKINEVIITIPHGNNEHIIKGISSLVSLYPDGKYRIKLKIKTNVADVIIDTDKSVNMECIYEIKKLFPNLYYDKKVK